MLHPTISRLETDAQRKKNEEKKAALSAKLLCSYAYSTDLIGHSLIEQVNREGKSQADWTNRHIVEK